MGRIIESVKASIRTGAEVFINLPWYLQIIIAVMLIVAVMRMVLWIYRFLFVWKK